LDAGQEISWYLVADVDQDHSALARLRDFLKDPLDVKQQAIEQDIDFSTYNLQKIVTNADGIQAS